MAGPTTPTQPEELRSLLRALPSLAGPLPSFDPSGAPPDPVTLFVTWLREAVDAGIREPHAMTVSTVDPQGHPSARMLILKNVDEHGWQFAVNDVSRKGKELANIPWAALTFYWAPQARQIRLRGPVGPARVEDSAHDYLARSPEARAAALVGRQSEPLGSREELDRALRQAHERLEREPDLVMPEWTLYTVAPEEVEFWQGDTGRRHTRLRYRRTGDTWSRELLWP